MVLTLWCRIWPCRGRSAHSWRHQREIRGTQIHTSTLEPSSLASNSAQRVSAPRFVSLCHMRQTLSPYTCLPLLNPLSLLMLRPDHVSEFLLFLCSRYHVVRDSRRPRTCHSHLTSRCRLMVLVPGWVFGQVLETMLPLQLISGGQSRSVQATRPRGGISALPWCVHPAPQLNHRRAPPIAPHHHGVPLNRMTMIPRPCPLQAKEEQWLEAGRALEQHLRLISPDFDAAIAARAVYARQQAADWSRWHSDDRRMRNAIREALEHSTKVRGQASSAWPILSSSAWPWPCLAVT